MYGRGDTPNRRTRSVLRFGEAASQRELLVKEVDETLHLRVFRRLMFRTVSQTMIRYRDSAQSLGATGDLHAGDRLPWVADAGAGDNYAPLTAIDWQVHVYGTPAPALADACRAHALPLHAFEWRDAMGAAGLRRDAIYLVRPDGYIGFAGGGDEAGRLAGYLEAWRIRLTARGG